MMENGIKEKKMVKEDMIAQMEIVTQDNLKMT